MKLRLLIRKNRHVDPEDLEGEWIRAGVFDLEDPNYVKAINAKRGKHLSRPAVLIYADGPLELPLSDEDIMLRMASGEWLYDVDDPNTWSPEQKQNYRRTGFVYDLCDLAVESQLTPAQKGEVVALVKRWELTSADFWELDSKPGTWGYDITRNGVKKTWHWKLRQVRNDKKAALFDAFADAT